MVSHQLFNVQKFSLKLENPHHFADCCLLGSCYLPLSEITSFSVFDDYVNVSLKMQNVQITHSALKYNYEMMSSVKLC